MLTIRLSRRGKKKQPTYRILISEKSKDPWGCFLEDLGFYNPKTKKTELKKDRIKYWVERGAQASPTVYNLLVSQGIIEGPKVKATKVKKRKEGKEEKEKKIKEKTEKVEKKKGEEEEKKESS